METISTLIAETFDFEPIASREPIVEVLTAPTISAATGRPATYEDEVFNFLLANKESLGIESVFRFKNLLLDGEILLTDRRRFAVEVKLRMNWLKACQAEWQFRKFQKRPKNHDSTQLNGGIVFFESFTSDWARPVGGIIRGWKNWHLEHSDIEGLRVKLIQLRDQRLRSIPG